LPNDVLLNITGASIGRVCVVPKDLCPANVNQHVSIIRLNGSISSQFLAFYLASPGFQKFINDSQAGATRQALTKQMIENFQIPAPSLAEQERIVAGLQDNLTVVERARAAAQYRMKAANALPAAYLRNVFENGAMKNWPFHRLGELVELLPSKSISSNGDIEVRAITTACLSERVWCAPGSGPGT